MDESHPQPPRYGILASNLSESVNYMLAEAHELGWLEAVEKILDVMSTKISQRCQKYSHTLQPELDSTLYVSMLL
jgi:hypothetical protein